MEIYIMSYGTHDEMLISVRDIIAPESRKMSNAVKWPTLIAYANAMLVDEELPGSNAVRNLEKELMYDDRMKIWHVIRCNAQALKLTDKDIDMIQAIRTSRILYNV